MFLQGTTPREVLLCCRIPIVLLFTYLYSVLGVRLFMTIHDCVLRCDGYWGRPFRRMQFSTQYFFHSILELMILNRIDKWIDDWIRTNHINCKTVELTCVNTILNSGNKIFYRQSSIFWKQFYILSFWAVTSFIISLFPTKSVNLFDIHVRHIWGERW